MEKFSWIKKFNELQEEGSGWISVSDIIPDEFDDYFLVHWNVGIIDNFPFQEYPDKNEKIEEINKRIKIDREFGLLPDPNEENLYRETTLKEIADKFKVEYNYKVLNEIKETPAIKILKNKSIENLKNLLQKLPNSDKLNLFVEDVYRFTDDDRPKQEIENISIKEYLKWQKAFDFDYCTYLFPDNKKWCLVTTEDVPMFLCTKREITKQIEKETCMEFFAVGYNEKLLSGLLT